MVGGLPQDFNYLKPAQKIKISVYKETMECKLLVKNYLEKKRQKLVTCSYFQSCVFKTSNFT